MTVLSRSHWPWSKGSKIMTAITRIFGRKPVTKLGGRYFWGTFGLEDFWNETLFVGGRPLLAGYLNIWYTFLFAENDQNTWLFDSFSLKGLARISIGISWSVHGWWLKLDKLANVTCTHFQASFLAKILIISSHANLLESGSAPKVRSPTRLKDWRSPILATLLIPLERSGSA